MSINKAIHVSSFDFDHCLLFGDEETRKVLTRDQIHKKNKVLLDAVKKQNQQFKYNVGYIGSNRNDVEIDNINRSKKDKSAAEDPTSCFVTTKTFVEATGAVFDPMLLADGYSKQEHGEAYRLALDPQSDADTHHQKHVFDDNKLSLVYMQVHQAANDGRNCDFIALNEVNEDDVKSIPKRANAAYIYCKKTQRLYYINTLEESFCSINNISNEQAKIEAIEGIEKAIKLDPAKGFTRTFHNKSFFGSSLTQEQLQVITNQTHHQHYSNDYPIIVDFYDDNIDILDCIKNYFSKNSQLLPKNVALRLNQHDEKSSHHLRDVHAIIRGRGKINPNPGQSLYEICNNYLESKISNPEFHFGRGAQSNLLKKAFKSKDTIIKLSKDAIIDSDAIDQTVVQTSLDFLTKRTLVGQFSSTRNQVHLKNWIKKFEQKNHYKFFGRWSFNLPRSKQQKELVLAVKTLIQCLDNRKKYSLQPEQVVILQNGPLAKSIQKLNVDVAQYQHRVINEKISEDVKKKIECLLQYKKKRQLRSSKSHIKLFFGVAKADKFNAVDALITALKFSPDDPSLLTEHRAALDDGRLKTLVNELGLKPTYHEPFKL